MEISEETVRRLEVLARLDLDPAERAQMRHDLASILAYVDQLQELDLANVEPTSHVLPLSQPLREDAARPSLPRALAEGNAPRTAPDGFLVPPVLGGADEVPHA